MIKGLMSAAAAVMLGIVCAASVFAAELPVTTQEEAVAGETASETTEAPSSGDKVILAGGIYTAGNEIAAGRYEIKGDSTVKVYTAGGDLKTNIILTTDKSLRGGVESYILTLRDGETIDVTADTTFEEYIPTKVTPNPSAASESGDTVRPAVASAPGTAAESKLNSKTGDNIPIALIAVIGAAALAVFAAFKLYKKKNR